MLPVISPSVPKQPKQDEFDVTAYLENIAQTCTGLTNPTNLHRSKRYKARVDGSLMLCDQQEDWQKQVTTFHELQRRG
jgi:hypothetical protein